jgi:hypothetical protein
MNRDGAQNHESDDGLENLDQFLRFVLLLGLDSVIACICLLGMAQNLHSQSRDEDGTNANRAKVTAKDGFSKGLDIGNPLVKCDHDRKSSKYEN